MAASAPPSSTGSTKLDGALQKTMANTPEKLSGVALYSRFALAGAVCCSITHGGLTPVDVVKTRIQLDPATYNRGMIGGFRQVIAKEGAGALLTGFGPTAAGYFLQGAFKFGGYELFKQQCINYLGYETASNNRTAVYLASSALAEFFADIALCPLEATRIRLVSEPTFASGLVSGFGKIAKQEGLGAFYSGFGPILFKQVPYTMAKFVVYEKCVEAVYKRVDKSQTTGGTQTIINLGCGLMAGFAAALVSQPADTMLSKINKTKGLPGEGTTSRLIKIARELGLRGSYTGIGARLFMVGTLTAGQFAIYGDIKKVLGATGGVEIAKLVIIQYDYNLEFTELPLPMDSTSVEDFQDYHNDRPIGELDDTLSSSPPPRGYARSVHLDTDDDEASLSGSAHHSPDEAVFDHHTRASSPRTSNGSDDEVSILGSHYEPNCEKPPPFTPQKTRPAFRNPSSVRAMQMDTTPPHLASPSSQHRHKLYTPSRQCTPRSVRSHRSAMGSPSKLSPTKKLKKEYPLVLLHVTLLPIPLVYSQEVMESVLPPSILENWKVLQEKATDTVLERGILIPHPKEDYDLLEERLLESLELKLPRILKCGHFHLSPEEEADVLAESDNDDPDDADDLDICLDCGRRIRDGKFGSAGTGSKRWDIKLFAANGLMRAGAWGAAWREMERVDVEILPWMEEDMKRELGLRKEEEERAKSERREEGVGGLDDERLREIYGGEAQAFVDGLIDETPATAEMASRVKRPERPLKKDIPLWDLFRDYVYHNVHDRRNIAILLLSVFVIFLSMRSFSDTQTTEALQTSYEGSTSGQPVPAMELRKKGQSNSITQYTSVPTTSSSSEAATSSTNAALPPSEEEEQNPEPPSWAETAGDEVSEIIED